MIKFFFWLWCVSSANDVMLSSGEQEVLAQALTQTATTYKESKQATVRLDGIMYHTPQWWIVWLNGRPYRPEEPCDYGRIVDVSHEKVHLEINPGQRHVVLQLNQEISLIP